MLLSGIDCKEYDKIQEWHNMVSSAYHWSDIHKFLSQVPSLIHKLGNNHIFVIYIDNTSMNGNNKHQFIYHEM